MSKKIVIELIETIAFTSENPVFKTIDFWKALTDFRKYGRSTPNPVRFDVDAEVKRIIRNLKKSQ